MAKFGLNVPHGIFEHLKLFNYRNSVRDQPGGGGGVGEWVKKLLSFFEKMA